MNGYALAWIVIAFAAAGGAGALHFVLRGARPLLRHALIVFALGFFLLPAPVPNYDGNMAPAFVVAIFELFFQADGRPGIALRILGLGLTAMVGMVCAAHYFGLADSLRRATEKLRAD